MTKKIENKPKPLLEARSTKPIKLKDRPGRRSIKFNLKDLFGFIPEELIWEKVQGKNNTFVVSALLTKKQLVKEKAAERAKKKKVEKKKKGGALFQK